MEQFVETAIADAARRLGLSMTDPLVIEARQVARVALSERNDVDFAIEFALQVLRKGTQVHAAA